MVAAMVANSSRLVAVIRGRANLLGAAGWVTAAFGAQQVLRLGTSVVLARLLAPQLLGTMVLINALRTGGELLSDLGIGQSIVKDPRGQDPLFYNTAWTLQIIRGFSLFLIALLATVPLVHLYGNDQLIWLIPVTSTIFIINGVIPPSSYLLQKRIDLRTLAVFNVSTAVLSSIIHISLALYTPTIWALVLGLLISSLTVVGGSFFLMDWRTLAIRVDREARSAIFNFGKWMFASSIIYFGAMNFDRLYFAKAVPLAVLGVYGIARTLADTVSLLTQRLGTLVIFPKMSAARTAAADLRKEILPVRRLALLFLAICLAAAVALSDKFIFLAYDARYRAAAIYLPVMLIGTWFSVLGAFADAMLMGIGKPSNVAAANAAKLLTIIAIVPLALSRGGILMAIFVFAGAEMVRYMALLWQKRRAGLAFSRQDVAATLFFLFMVLFWREATGWIGITGGLGSWVHAARVALG
jgi:O-antigen/teichoic acid export membrane protein